MTTLFKRALRHVRDRSIGGPVPFDLPITLNFHPDTSASGMDAIESLARDGVYRSQFETGASNGGLTAYPGGERWAWESRMFNGAYDRADPSLRPKYGTLNYRQLAVGGSPRFGSCHFRLRSSVRGRTSFCYPDSHLDPQDFGVADRLSLIALAEENRSGLDFLDNYIEAQVHGPIKIEEDVEAIVLDPCYRGTSVERAAVTLPCALEWHHGFRLTLDLLDDCEHYRGPIARKAIAAIGVDGVITPLQIGAARRAGMDYQTAKWAWHCVARFGRG